MLAFDRRPGNLAGLEDAPVAGRRQGNDQGGIALEAVEVNRDAAHALVALGVGHPEGVVVLLEVHSSEHLPVVGIRVADEAAKGQYAVGVIPFFSLEIEAVLAADARLGDVLGHGAVLSATDETHEPIECGSGRAILPNQVAVLAPDIALQVAPVRNAQH